MPLALLVLLAACGPAAERIFLYNNGSGRPGPNESRALEIVDIGGAWREILSFDDGGSDGYTPLWGDADWLSDGRDLIVKPHCWHCFAVPAHQRTDVDRRLRHLREPAVLPVGSTPGRIRSRGPGSRPRTRAR